MDQFWENKIIAPSTVNVGFIYIAYCHVTMFRKQIVTWDTDADGDCGCTVMCRFQYTSLGINGQMTRRGLLYGKDEDKAYCNGPLGSQQYFRMVRKFHGDLRMGNRFYKAVPLSQQCKGVCQVGSCSNDEKNVISSRFENKMETTLEEEDKQSKFLSLLALSGST